MLIGAVYMSANATQVILLFWTGLTLRLKAALEGEYYQSTAPKIDAIEWQQTAVGWAYQGLRDVIGASTSERRKR